MGMIPQQCEYCDERVAPIRQGENTELVEDVSPVGDGGEQPFEVVLIDTLRKKGSDFEK